MAEMIKFKVQDKTVCKETVTLVVYFIANNIQFL